MRSLSLLSLALLAAPALMAVDGNTASVQVPVAARIVAPVKLILDGQVDFGTLVLDDLSTPASVTMASSPNGGTSFSKIDKCTPYVKTLRPTSATIHIQRESGLDVGIQIANTKIGATTFMPKTPALEDCTINFPTKTPTTKQEHFNLEGTLMIPAGATGTHTGLVNVTVSYK